MQNNPNKNYKKKKLPKLISKFNQVLKETKEEYFLLLDGKVKSNRTLWVSWV